MGLFFTDTEVTLYIVTPCFYYGGDEGDRTPDLSVANAALSQLSYIPTLVLMGLQKAALGRQ